MNTSRTASRLRAQIARFSADLSVGLGVVAGRFVGEMVYGIQASESVLLTEIGRALEEEVPLRKTEWRPNVLREARGRITEESLLVLDPSDITKKHAMYRSFPQTPICVSTYFSAKTP